MIIVFLGIGAAAWRAFLEGDIGPKDQRIVRVESAFHIQKHPVARNAGDIIVVAAGNEGRVPRRRILQE